MCYAYVTYFTLFKCDDFLWSNLNTTENTETTFKLKRNHIIFHTGFIQLTVNCVWWWAIIKFNSVPIRVFNKHTLIAFLSYIFLGVWNKWVIMNWANESSPKEFILLGFSDRAWLQMPLFVVLLISYTITIFGNVSIMMVCILDPKLHTPMYFFLTNLSILDLCYTTTTVPHMLVNIGYNKKTISYAGCVAQLIIFLALGATECLLLAVMSFDRYVAICRPLHYVVIMNYWFCLRMAAFSWFTGFSNSVLQSSLTLNMPRCGHQEVDHFFCEVPALLKLSCADTKPIEAELFFFSVLILLIPVTLILISYGFIAQAVLKIRSAEGRRKAFGTCGSHMVVVSLFYGTAIYMYLQPPSSTSKDWGKMVSLFYGIITPMLNPLIYSLRNKDMKEAFKRVMPRIFFCKK